MNFDRSRFIRKFTQEAQELIFKMNDALLRLEKKPSDLAVFEDILRAIHTLKGASKIVRFDTINLLSHKMEDLFIAVQDGKLILTEDIIELLFHGTDTLDLCVKGILRGQEEGVDVTELRVALDETVAGTSPLEYLAQHTSQLRNADNVAESGFGARTSCPSPLSGQDARAPTSTALKNADIPDDAVASEPLPHIQESIRVGIETLDNTIRLVGELSLGRKKAEHTVALLKELLRTTRLHAKRLQHIFQETESHIPHELKTDIIGESQHILHTLEPVFHDSRDELAMRELVVSELYDDVLTMRMLPLSVITEVRETLHIFTNEVSLVLDNALLYKQLEQSNRELEETITALKNTQSQLIQSEKMASIGQLVAGVAHEINTPTGAINAATSNIMNFLPSLIENFRHVSQLHLSQDAQETLLAFITRLIHAPAQERRSTLDTRKITKHFENVLAQKGFSNSRRIAKQIARLNLEEQEFSTLLQILRTYHSEYLMNFLEDCSKIINSTKNIQLSSNIITRIVNALKMYSRLDQTKVEEVNIHDGIETTLILLHSQTKYGIRVEKEYGEIPAIPCYANELNQVWTNIIHNAVQAMNGNGTLTIRTYFIPENAQSQSNGQEEGTASGGMIGAAISDTGPGIPPNILDKIFDPYFTAKDQGEGSGLGLGIARQIIERHQGTIRVRSKPGETSFEVLLPVSGVLEEYLAQ